MSEEEDKDGSGGKRRITDADFAAMKELYELGKLGVTELSDEFGVSRQAISKRFKDAGIVRGSRAHELAATAGAAVKAVTERFAESKAQWIEETRIEAVKTLKQTRLIGQRMVVDAMKGAAAAGATAGSLAGIDDDMRALGRYNKLIIDNYNAALGILKADEHVDDEDLPNLTVDDLTNEDVLEHHISTGALPEDATIDDLNLE